MPEADVEDEVTSILTDIDLLDKADAIAEKLSGGQKRKLSVGELSQSFFNFVNKGSSFCRV
jgi:ABC-type polar amino acid transport system ATPase subunit